MDGTGEHYAKWNKPGSRRQIPYDLTYKWNLIKSVFLTNISTIQQETFLNIATFTKLKHKKQAIQQKNGQKM